MVKATRILLLLALWLTTVAAQAANSATASVDRDRIYFGESLTLTITLSGKARAHEPDLAPLRDDFAVLGTSTSTRMQIINGDASMEMEWRIQLEPIHSGKLVIPPLRIGPYVTDAIDVQVLPASQMPKGQADTVFIEVEAEPKNPYVQQQVLLTVRLFHAVSLLDGSLDEPAGDDWMVKRLDKNDTRYETSRNGQRYGVVERRYALFPQKSGQLTLPALSFQGRIATQSSINRFFDQGRAVRRQSSPLQFKVRPRPAAFPKGAVWLPAHNLELWEDFPAAHSFQQGEPITRTLILKADGLLGAQLPNLPTPTVAGLSAYPDQPVTREQVGKQGMHSEKEQKIALVPNRAGELQLPQLSIPWWNVDTDKLEYARLPARKLRVEPSSKVAPASRQPNQAPAVKLPVDATGKTATPKPETVAPAGIPAWLWPWIALFLLLGWMLNVGFCLRKRARPAQPAAEESPPAVDTRAARKAWQAAAESGDLARMQQALLQWARAEGYPVNNLSELAQQLVETDLAEEVRRLEQARYQPGSQWQADHLLQLLKSGLPRPGTREQDMQKPLPGLYE